MTPELKSAISTYFNREKANGLPIIAAMIEFGVNTQMVAEATEMPLDVVGYYLMYWGAEPSFGGWSPERAGATPTAKQTKFIEWQKRQPAIDGPGTIGDGFVRNNINPYDAVHIQRAQDMIDRAGRANAVRLFNGMAIVTPPWEA
ncbi:MAG: hypothetical protein RL758_283 [Pseudomonadota bacterium]